MKPDGPEEEDLGGMVVVVVFVVVVSTRNCSRSCSKRDMLT